MFTLTDFWPGDSCKEGALNVTRTECNRFFPERRISISCFLLMLVWMGCLFKVFLSIVLRITTAHNFLRHERAHSGPRGFPVRIERFSIVSKVISKLLWFCIAKNLAPLSRPIRSQTRTNRDLPVHVFPRLVPATCICFEP